MFLTELHPTTQIKTKGSEGPLSSDLSPSAASKELTDQKPIELSEAGQR